MGDYIEILGFITQSISITMYNVIILMPNLLPLKQQSIQKCHNMNINMLLTKMFYQNMRCYGIVYHSIRDRISRDLNKLKDKINLIAVHSGSGCSICYITNDRSIDTSLGTPSGDVDDRLLFQLMNMNKTIENISITNDICLHMNKETY